MGKLGQSSFCAASRADYYRQNFEIQNRMNGEEEKKKKKKKWLTFILVFSTCCTKPVLRWQVPLQPIDWPSLCVALIANGWEDPGWHLVASLAGTGRMSCALFWTRCTLPSLPRAAVILWNLLVASFLSDGWIQPPDAQWWETLVVGASYIWSCCRQESCRDFCSQRWFFLDWSVFWFYCVRKGRIVMRRGVRCWVWLVQCCR